VSINAYNALHAVHRRIPRTVESEEIETKEPEHVRMVRTEAVKLALAGTPMTDAMQKITSAVPQVSVDEQLRIEASKSLTGAEKIREKLLQDYGPFRIIGKARGVWSGLRKAPKCCDS
jgi:hypothetical protein